jgi:hypothetical protein
MDIESLEYESLKYKTALDIEIGDTLVLDDGSEFTVVSKKRNAVYEVPEGSTFDIYSKDKYGETIESFAVPPYFAHQVKEKQK